MSDAHSHGTHSAGSNAMNLGKIVLVGVVSLLLFAVGIVWAYRIMVARQAEVEGQGLARVPTEIGKPEIGIVDQVPFSIDHRLEVWKANNRKHLSSYGWVDRAKGVVHIPIERAMEQVIASPPDIPGESVPPAALTPVVPPPPAATDAKPGRTP